VIPPKSRMDVCSHLYLYRVHSWFSAYFKCDINNVIQLGGIEATQARIRAAGLHVVLLKAFSTRKEHKMEPCELRPRQSQEASAGPSFKSTDVPGTSGPAATTHRPQLNYQELADIFQRPGDLGKPGDRDPLAGMTPSDKKEAQKVLQYVAVQRLLNPKINDAEIQLGYYAMEIDLQAGQAYSQRSFRYRSRTSKLHEEGKKSKRKPMYGGFDTLLGSLSEPAHTMEWWFGLKPIDSERSIVRPPSPDRPGVSSGSRSERSGKMMLM